MTHEIIQQYHCPTADTTVDFIDHKSQQHSQLCKPEDIEVLTKGFKNNKVRKAIALEINIAQGHVEEPEVKQEKFW